ncbi:glycosyltransferase 61 family protein [Helicobacter sp. MIT 99-5507]|uniref:glycosyltransferase 61 family protein n=1 Tax=Helicobacter sp. MIT 99-5507 TaxID=152489 RepID=UPI0015F150F9|nr:glycosyltransferase family 61 protein [Helicobacter sp. MIT 99-5507]
MQLGGGQQHKIDIIDRIYISRKKSPRRYLSNEKEIIEILEKQFNFKVLYMEDYSLCKKINIMQNAKVVMSIEGTSLINGLFMNAKDSKLIALRSFDMTEHIFIISSMFKNIEFLPIVCDIKNKIGDSAFWVESDLYLDKDYLIKKLKEYEIEPIN